MSGSSRWIVDIQKVLGGEYWTNVYNVLASNLATAVGIGQQIVALERSISPSTITFDLMRVRPALLPAGGGTVVGLGLAGALTWNPADKQLPLFNVVRVDLRPATGRPSRKYLRGTLNQATVGDNYNMIAAQRTAIETNYLTPLLTIEGLCDVDGQTFNGGLVYPQIAMRQLRRGSKRPVVTP